MKNIKFMVWVEGGHIQDVRTNCANIEFEVYDADADSEYKEEITLKWDYDLAKFGMNDKVLTFIPDNAADIIRHNIENND